MLRTHKGDRVYNSTRSWTQHYVEISRNLHKNKDVIRRYTTLIIANKKNKKQLQVSAA
jgi:hypothetical protein